MTRGALDRYHSRRSLSAGRITTMRTRPILTIVEMGEVYEEERSLDHWLDPEGRKQPFGQMHLKENELLCPEGRDHWSVEQEIREATGNEGVSMDRWYRQGVIVIWPRDRYFGILAGEGQVSAIPALEQMAAGSKSDTSLAACRTFADGNHRPLESPPPRRRHPRVPGTAAHARTA